MPQPHPYFALSPTDLKAGERARFKFSFRSGNIRLSFGQLRPNHMRIPTHHFYLEGRCGRLCGWGLLYLSLLGAGLRAEPYSAELNPHQKLVRDIYRELIEINTTHSVGDTTRAANAMAVRLKAAGFPAADVQVLGLAAERGNLVARFRGSGAAKPILLLAHLDVVEAKREDWSVEPFQLLERDGYFYGRGTEDDKAMAAIWIANLIRYRQEGLTPSRDLVVALTAEEESGKEEYNGVKWLLANHREIINAEFCLNEGGGGVIKKGRRLLNEVQASEKTYLSFRLEVKNRGGHSSLPTKDNAIYRLAAGLLRLSQFEFPVKLDDITRGYFRRMAALETGQTALDFEAVTRTPPDAAAVERLAATPYYNALMRTTWTPTMLEGGHAQNALPQMAGAVVNCRLLPSQTPDELEKILIEALADPQIRVTRVSEPVAGPASPLEPRLMQIIERTTTDLWPGVSVAPVMSTGATDGLFLRNAGIPTYGISGIFEDIEDIRAHGRDERLGVKELYEGQEFLYRLVKSLVSQ
jgi:acetylornithine deacetylase/succinyl-diaminopimelate desuccinylase-like protein